MRFKVTLEKIKYDVLPIDYQYALASWIYATVHSGNSEFGNWLHEKGYSSGNRNYKLFCFSRLFFRFNPMGDRIQMTSREADFQISFVAEATVEPFIIGLFQNQSLTLGDNKSRVDFQIKSVERLPDMDFSSGKSQFTLRSPLCLSTSSPDKKTATYLSPDYVGYAEYLKSNLFNKYLALFPDADLSQIPFSFKVLNRADSKLITIRNGESSETKVRGYLYSFELSSSKELLSFAYSSGFGEKNSMGFGFADVKK